MKKILIILAMLLGALTLLACEVSTAELSDVKICSDADATSGDCSTDTTLFKTTDPVIYLSASLANAPDDTTVTATWNYLRGDLGNEKQEIDAVSASAKDSGSMPFHASLSAPAKGWPQGDYEVVLSLSNDNSTPITKTFSVK